MKRYILTKLLIIICLMSHGQLSVNYSEIKETTDNLTCLRFEYNQLFNQEIGESLTINNFEFGNATYTLDLQKFRVWDENTVIVAVDETGEIQQPLPDLVLYKGVILEEDSSFVYFAINESGYATGYASHNNNVIPISRPSDKGRIERLLQNVSKRDHKDFCGVEGIDSFPDGSGLDNIDLINFNRTSMLVDIIAVEMDNECFQLFSDLTEAREYPFILLGAVSGIYERDILSHFTVTYLHIWTIPDPYTFLPSQTCGEDGALAQFKAYWNENFTGVPRNHAVMLAGNLEGGCASRAALNDDRSYAACGIDGVLVLPIPFNSPDNWDPYVVGHEIGHNYGSPHTHCYEPPIDLCENADGGCYDGPIVYTHGTIMSYCHEGPEGVAAIDMEFHPRCINETMRPYAASKLSTLPAYLVLNTPGVLGNWAASIQITLDPGFSTSFYFETEILESGKNESKNPIFELQIFLPQDQILNLGIEEFPLKSSIYPNLWTGSDSFGNKVATNDYQYIITKDDSEVEKGTIQIK